MGRLRLRKFLCVRAHTAGERLRGAAAESVKLTVKFHTKKDVDELIAALRIIRECFVL